MIKATVCKAAQSINITGRHQDAMDELINLNMMAVAEFAKRSGRSAESIAQELSWRLEAMQQREEESA